MYKMVLLLYLLENWWVKFVENDREEMAVNWVL